MALSVEDWLAVAAIALPLIAKAFTDWSTNAATQKHIALANITGMAGRQAATIARSLDALPKGADTKAAEQALIAGAARALFAEMAESSAKTDGNIDKLAVIVQGEVAKLVVPKKPIPSVAEVVAAS